MEKREGIRKEEAVVVNTADKPREPEVRKRLLVLGVWEGCP